MLFLDRVLVLTSGLLIYGTPLIAAEDVTITYKVTNDEGGTSNRHKYISPGRAEAWSGPDYGFITDSTGKMTRTDHARAQYTETTEQQENAAFQQSQRIPAPKSQPTDTSVSFEKVPGGRTIAGQNCEHYVVTTRKRFGDSRPEPSDVGTCGQTMFMAFGGDNDEDVAWDATKKAWRSCVKEKLGGKWTVIRAAKKQCVPRKDGIAWTGVVAQGTKVVACRQTGGDPQSRWFCHLNAVPCIAPTTP